MIQTITDTENNIKFDKTEIGEPEPKIRRMSDIVSTSCETFEQYKQRREMMAPDYESATNIRVRAGFTDNIRQLMYTPQGIKIMGGEAMMSLGDIFGSENTVKRGVSLIQAANVELDAKLQEAEKRRFPLSQEDYDSFSYMLGAGGANYGVLLASGYLTGGAGALATGAVMEASAETLEGVQVYKEKSGDKKLENISSEWSEKELGTTLLYTAGATIMEKKLGFGQQMKVFKTPLSSKIKTILTTAASEGVTETAQSLLNMGIDLADGTIDWNQMPENLRGAFMEGAVGAVLGGTAGTAAAINHRSQAKAILRENLDKVVPEKNLNTVVDDIYEKGNNAISNVIATELSLSSELRSKHGAIYDSMQRAIKRAADESGAFKNVTEEDLSEYVGDTAKLFADQVLAEANQRNVTIDEVLKASDIVYEDGGIRLKNKNVVEGEVLEQAMYKSKLNSLESFVEDVLNNQEDTSARYFANVSPSGINFDIPRDTVLHDKKHSLTASEWAEVAENIDNIESVTISPKKRFDGQAVLLKITTPSGKYGVVFEHMKNGRNIITTAFKDTDAKLDAWIKENSAKAMQTAPTTQKGLLSGRSMFDIISVLDENVNNALYQGRPNPKGSFDTKTGLIKIFENADFSTLPHELAHYWLDNMWNYTRSGNASEQYQQRWNVIANWLNVKPEQSRLTRGQQEKFARGYEQYLLNGELPTPIIKGAFDDYDRWLKRVYGDMNRLNVRLSEDAVRFFQSMTTGKLAEPKLKPLRKPKGKMTLTERLREKMNMQRQDEQEQKAVQAISETEISRPLPENAEQKTIILSNITEGNKGESRVYHRETERNIDTLAEIADVDLEYNKINLEEQAKRAEEFVKNNLDEARMIVDGSKSAPENILDTAIRIAYEQEMLRIGNNAEYLRALKLHSSLQTLRGQEISAEKISTKDITSPTYWINKVVAARTHKIATRLFRNYVAWGSDTSLDSYKKMVKEEVSSISKKVLAEESPERQKKVLDEELKRLRREYGLENKQMELFQMPLDKPLNSRNVKMYVNEALDNLFGTTVTQEEANQIIGKIDELSRSIENTLDETGNPSIQTWAKINEVNNLVESLSPSPALQIATSIVGRGVMLASVKSPVLNIISNSENILTEMLVRRAINTIDGGATQSAVDRNVVTEYLRYANDVYRASGYNVSTTQNLDTTTVTLGEQRISTQGKGRFREFARGVETGVFKYLMGYPDSISKDIVFSDSASLEATSIAKNEGFDGKGLTDRATELFKDAARVEPLTEEGRIIRDKAIREANVTTYTNDTMFSKFALGIRETLNNVTGNVRLGDQLMPFVKTPANVVALGLEYSAGLAYALPNLPVIIKDIRTGNLSQKSRRAIKASVRNGMGIVLAMLIAMSFEPDDYTPEYDALTPSERRLAMEKGAVFNSIRIGNKYVSLDYFGPLAFPLTAVLSSRRNSNNYLYEYAKGTASQLMKTPGLKEFSNLIDDIDMSVKRKPEDTAKALGNFFIDYVRARTIPAFVNDIAKMMDSVDRETSGGMLDKAQASIPGVRQLLPEKYTTTSKMPKKTESAISILLFGSRVKTANINRVVYEIDRLYKNDARVTITDVTRSGKLSDLNEEKQQRVRKEFAKRYYDRVYKLVSSRTYRRKDDEQKANAINKVRRTIIEDLKKKYVK